MFLSSHVQELTLIAPLTDIFDNRGNPDPLQIVYRQSYVVPADPPQDYAAGNVPSFTYVYGKGEEYSNGIAGKGRRRIGLSPRDYTVFTVK